MQHSSGDPSLWSVTRMEERTLDSRGPGLARLKIATGRDVGEARQGRGGGEALEKRNVAQRPAHHSSPAAQNASHDHGCRSRGIDSRSPLTRPRSRRPL